MRELRYECFWLNNGGLVLDFVLGFDGSVWFSLLEWKFYKRTVFMLVIILFLVFTYSGYVRNIYWMWNEWSWNVLGVVLRNGKV